MANITWHPLSMDYVCTHAIICRYHLCIREKSIDRVSPLSVQNKTVWLREQLEYIMKKGNVQLKSKIASKEYNSIQWKYIVTGDTCINSSALPGLLLKKSKNLGSFFKHQFSSTSVRLIL